MSLLKNTASQVVTFCLVNATDGSALTGATVTTKVTKDGTQAASAGTLTELGSGQYKYVPTQGETNAASVGLLFTATNAVPVNLHMFTDDYAARDAAVADAVWDEVRSGHVAAGSTGQIAQYVADIYEVGDGSGGIWVGGGSVSNIADAVWDETLDPDHIGNPDGTGTALYVVRDNSTSFSAAALADAVWDEATADHVTAGTTGKKLGDISTGTPLGAADIRAAIGLAAADLDAQIAALPTAAENADANWDEARAGHVAAGSFGENVIADVTKILGSAANGGPTAGTLDVRLDDISVAGLTALSSAVIGRIATDGVDANSIKADAVTKIQNGLATPTNITAGTLTTVTNLTNLPAAAALEATLTAMKGATFAGATDSLEAIRDRGDAAWATATGFSTLDAAGVRAAIGMASNNLDTQLSNTYNRIGAPVFGNISGDIAANYAILTNIEDSVGVGVSADVVAIKAKTDNLPADPASSTNVTAVYSRVGAPAGASVSADIAAVKAETATINTATGAAAIRTAVGLAAANLDTQLAAIDDLLDTEIGAIKAKTDLIPASPAAVGSAMTLADEAITDAKIAELAFQGKHFDTDVEISAVTGAVGSVTAGVTVTTNNDKTGYTLTSGERNSVADALLDRADGAVSGKTLREALSVILGVLSGKVSGAGTTTITFRHINDTKDVIVATVDAAGNRTAVTVTP